MKIIQFDINPVPSTDITNDFISPLSLDVVLASHSQSKNFEYKIL